MLELSADRGAKDRQRIANVRVNLESLTKVTRRVRGRLQSASSSRGTDKRKDRGGGGKLHGGRPFFSFFAKQRFVGRKRGLQKMSVGAELMSKDLLRHRARATKILPTFWDSKILVVLLIFYKVHVSL
jgi:hypothetical protein